MLGSENSEGEEIFSEFFPRRLYQFVLERRMKNCHLSKFIRYRFGVNEHDGKKSRYSLDYVSQDNEQKK